MVEKDAAPDAPAEESRGPQGKVSDGIRQGLGVLAALKDAIEEQISEARERGDLTPERAREAMRSAVARAQGAAGEARERLDLVSQKEFDLLRGQVDELKARLDRLDGATPSGPGPDGSG